MHVMAPLKDTSTAHINPTKMNVIICGLWDWMVHGPRVEARYDCLHAVTTATVAVCFDESTHLDFLLVIAPVWMLVWMVARMIVRLCSVWTLI